MKKLIAGPGVYICDECIDLCNEIIDIRQRLDHIIAKHTKQDYEKVRTDTERDYFMSSEEAVEYGIIDRVISEH